jgi:hypothetical protein
MSSEKENDDPLVWISQRNLSRSGKTKIVSGALHSSLSSREELLPVITMNGVEVKVSNNGEEFGISELWSPLMSVR